MNPTQLNGWSLKTTYLGNCNGGCSVNANLTTTQYLAKFCNVNLGVDSWNFKNYMA